MECGRPASRGEREPHTPARRRGCSGRRRARARGRAPAQGGRRSRAPPPDKARPPGCAPRRGRPALRAPAPPPASGRRPRRRCSPPRRRRRRGTRRCRPAAGWPSARRWPGLRLLMGPPWRSNGVRRPWSVALCRAGGVAAIDRDAVGPLEAGVGPVEADEDHGRMRRAPAGRRNPSGPAAWWRPRARSRACRSPRSPRAFPAWRRRPADCGE